MLFLFQLQSSTSTEIKAVHETPVKGYKDDLTFTLTPNQNGCAVHVRIDFCYSRLTIQYFFKTIT